MTHSMRSSSWDLEIQKREVPAAVYGMGGKGNHSGRLYPLFKQWHGGREGGREGGRWWLC